MASTKQQQIKQASSTAEEDDEFEEFQEQGDFDVLHRLTANVKPEQSAFLNGRFLLHKQTGASS